MKKYISTRIAVFLTAILLFPGCKKENSPKTGLVNDPVCKNQQKSSLSGTVPDTLSCVEYAFDQDNNRLTLTHVNAAFNCCPGSLSVEHSVDGNLITVEEHESAAQCDCDCLYDLVFEIDGLAAGLYQIRFLEPYAGNQEELFFEADLEDTPVGSYCVTRKQYPWGLASTE